MEMDWKIYLLVHQWGNLHNFTCKLMMENLFFRPLSHGKQIAFAKIYRPPSLMPMETAIWIYML